MKDAQVVFCLAHLPPKNLPFWTPTIVIASWQSLTQASNGTFLPIPAHTDPLLPVPLTCAGAYTLLPGQYKPAACSLPQTGTINIVPSLERLLKAKQLSGQAANSADRSA